MPNTLLLDQNQWVANLFQNILKVLENLDWKQEFSDVFLVYAHNNHKIDKQADAEIARLLIKWLKQVGTHVYSDQNGAGNPVIPKATPSDTSKVHDILNSQLGLLTSNPLTFPDDKRRNIVLCGSALLTHYFYSDYYQNHYYPGLKQAYEDAQKQASRIEARSKLADYVNSQLNVEGFHHVLTELAFLQIRTENERASHGIVPLLLNRKGKEGFPEFIMDSTTVRIEEAVWRKSGIWNGQMTYENESLHVGFFKLLKRLWVTKQDEIQMMGEGVYKDCLQMLRSWEAPPSEYAFNTIMLDLISKAQQELIHKNSATMRMLEPQKWFNRIETTLLKRREKDHEFELEKHLKEWYPTLTHHLAIQRVSGEMLPMESCYINLAVLEHQLKKFNNEEGAKARQTFCRLPSVESMESTNFKKLIALEDLFKPKRLKSGNEGMPKRILIRGRAGIGKTTLAKKGLYGYLHHSLWREHFEWVLWIPLRHLKGKKEHYSLESLLYEEYFEQRPDAWDLAQRLYRRIQAAPSKTLLICDGWDEVVQERRVACLSEVLNHPSVIITSRPYGIKVTEIKALDLELETIGFSETNVEAYLDHRDIVESTEVAEAIKLFIKQHPFVRELVNIPIQLDALCYSWDEISDERSSTPTMTALYEGMVNKLWRKDMVRLEKLVDGNVLTEERVQRVRPFRHLEPLIKAEQACLGAVALNGLHRNQLEFKPKDLEEVIQQLEKDHHALPMELEANVMKLSCLQVEKNPQSLNQVSYQFLHLTFQEFFAAQWLAECLREDKTLSLVGWPGIKAESFIWEHQYNPRYEIVWWFVAGLLSGKTLKIFFDRLNQGPQDLIGIQHQCLMMHCLKESNGKLPKEEQEQLESDLYAWVEFEVEQDETIETISTLGRQTAFPEALLCKCLEDQWCRMKHVIANTLGCRPTLSNSAVASLIGLCQDENKCVRVAAVEVLSKPSNLSPEVRASLSSFCEDEDEEVGRLVLDTLGLKPIISSEMMHTMIEFCRSQRDALDMYVSGLGRLNQRPDLSSETEASLIEFCKDKDERVRTSAAEALGRQSNLSPEGGACLFGLFVTDEARSVQVAALGALGQQPAWHGYQYLLIADPAFIKNLYRHWLIPSNFKQISPLYIKDNQLCFYTSTQFKSIAVDKVAEFKEAILKAQTELGIPVASRIKLDIQNTGSAHDQPSSRSRFKYKVSKFFRSFHDDPNRTQESAGNSHFRRAM